MTTKDEIAVFIGISKRLKSGYHARYIAARVDDVTALGHKRGLILARGVKNADTAEAVLALIRAAPRHVRQGLGIAMLEAWML